MDMYNYKPTSVGSNDFSDLDFTELLKECGIANPAPIKDEDGFEYERRLDDVDN